MSRLPDIYDEPFADSSQIPTFLVSQLTKQSVTVSLSGDGGDELFGGYNRYLFAEKIKRFIVDRRGSRVLFKCLPDKLLEFLEYIPQKRVVALVDKLKKIKGMLRESNASFPIFYRNLCSQCYNPSRLVLNSREHDILIEKDYMPVLDEIRSLPWMMLMDACTYMIDDILVKVDRAAMAVSLETRVPFLDHAIFEFAWQLPLAFKVKGTCGKLILRDILYRHVPQKLIERPKMGFGIPYGEWLRTDLKEWASELLHPEKISQQGYLNPIEVQRYWSEHQSGQRNWQSVLWSILMFQAWLHKTGHS